ncbi:NTP transferase domain-containing protein [Candidatus Woesearchaeota archaeon]|nr:NTP transferase domain-containing protein [Candidatus Woesearchaeota archaeon]
MKGIILAGGTGTRLNPLTLVTNKHLLPVYSKPMIYCPLHTLLKAGIKNILIISGPDHAGHFLKLLKSGKNFDATFTYEIQEEAGGIGQALGLAKDFVGDDKCVVILGDNIFEEDIAPYVKEFEKQKEGARIFLKEVSMEDAKKFGIALVNDGKVTYVEEKPKKPKSNLAMTGLYMFDSKVFGIIRKLKPSWRNEIEVTDALDAYVKKGQLYYNKIRKFWSDAGSFDSLLRASIMMRNLENRNGKNKK